MEQERISISDKVSARVYTCGTAIVGSGAAGYNAADRLWQMGQRDILMVTEARMAGTSRNTGSDKQTYYKLTLSGGDPDSVGAMAETLFSGQCVDGDLALCEAALSSQCFYKLAELGVEFPRSRFGEYVGYKTDHDPRRRATSAGPYTSRQMTEVLEASVLQKGIPMLDQTQVIRVIGDGKKVLGLLCLNRQEKDEQDRFVLICCHNVIYATGGPAGIYADSVYPASQFGATGIALEAGVRGKNLTEWQYGLASLRPRWNVSGTYMQVLPRVYSVAAEGGEEREFLMDFFETKEQMLDMLFLKGYQWPFDVRKIENGSSIIDILVFLETQKGRRVFLDFRSNPGGEELPFSDLSPEARTYLERAGACFGTPIQRLQHMNQPAVDLYRDKGVDLTREPLEIALSAQHNNGGLAIDAWWQTDLEGFFAVGEAAASHGVYRPGGTALNAGQVGSTRAAQYIAARRKGGPDTGDIEMFRREAAAALSEMADLAAAALGRGASGKRETEGQDARELWRKASRRMSLCGGAFRNVQEIQECLRQVEQELSALSDRVSVGSPRELVWLYRLRDTLLCQTAYLTAMADYGSQGGGSRGSALYTDVSGKKPYASLPDTFTYTLDDGGKGDVIQEVWRQDGRWCVEWRPVRPIPQEDDFFENVWNEYRRTGNVG